MRSQKCVMCLNNRCRQRRQHSRGWNRFSAEIRYHLTQSSKRKGRVINCSCSVSSAQKRLHAKNDRTSRFVQHAQFKTICCLTYKHFYSIVLKQSGFLTSYQIHSHFISVNAKWCPSHHSYLTKITAKAETPACQFLFCFCSSSDWHHLFLLILWMRQKRQQQFRNIIYADDEYSTISFFLVSRWRSLG